MAEIKLTYDRDITIAVGLSVSSKVWKNTKTTWSALVKKLSVPVVTGEKYAHFIAATKEEQGRIKDVGGFVGGSLIKGRRDKSHVLNRSVLTLDIDFSHADFWWNFTLLFDCAAVLHSTHKSSVNAPRHRLIIPLLRDVGQEEYLAIAHKVAEMCSIELFDPSTFDVNRLMFWPSVSSDSEYYFEYQDGPMLDPDYILGLYADWHNTAEWAIAGHDDTSMLKEVAEQEDPLTKRGIVGMFCRTYSIQEAIDTFLSDIYAPTVNGRYTYTKGSTVAGLVLYEDRFAYSHHGTDPAGGKLCNAFDLVRIHKFGMLDKPGQGSGEKSKSFKAMENFALSDPLVRQSISKERLANARNDFAEIADFESSGSPEKSGAATEPEEYDNSWTSQLTANSKGEYESTAGNLNTIMNNDPYLNGAFRMNLFDKRRYVVKTVPWHKIDKGMELFNDTDFAGVHNYVECIYGIASRQKVEDALTLSAAKHGFHPIQDYLKSLQWDGARRIDTLLIDYFGAYDNVYTRAAIRKILCAAVARVFNPGTKFDLALILVGQQGTYKSTFVKKLGKDWFSDTFTTMQGKEAFEQVQGAWIIEMAELSGLRKADVESIKHYISKDQDQFRAAYARTVEVYPRQCVFFGTTNSVDFLHDSTGNRRFMPIDVRPDFVKKSVPAELTDSEVDQIWAEAYQLYLAGEKLYLSAVEERFAEAEQHKHSEIDERMGLVEEYLNKKYPVSWPDMDINQRRVWLDDPLASKGVESKNAVCIAEIWCECLGKSKDDMTRYNTRDVNDIMRSIPGWEYSNSTMQFPIYGKQKYYKRKKPNLSVFNEEDELW